MAAIVRETNSFIKSKSLSIQTIPEKMKTDRSNLLKKNSDKGISCAPLLQTQTLVSGSKMHPKKFFFQIIFAICHHLA